MEFLAESVGFLDVTPTKKAAIVVEVRDSESENPKDMNDTVLTKYVNDKACPNGDLFSGRVDAFTGELVHGRRIYVTSQEAYEGPFLKSNRHGAGGICTKLDGSGKFIGTFRDDEFDEGTFITSDYSYVGHFKGGRFWQYGTLALSDGTVYEGEFKNGIFHGQGKLISPNKDVYHGSFLVGQKEGEGTMRYGDGGIYEGMWRSDVKHGSGKEIYTDTILSYEGDFLYDQRQGRGTMYSPKVELTGPWCNGKSVDSQDWKIVYPKKGIVYEGAALACRPHGYGKLVLQQDKGSVVYEGDFICGLRHGSGRITSQCSPDDANKTTWKGDLPCNDLELMNVVSFHDDSQSSRKILLHLDSALGHDDSLNIPTMISLDSVSLTASDESCHVDNSVDDQHKTYRNGDTYQGLLDISGKRYGFGIYTQKLTGAIYSGEFRDSRRHGKGTFTSPLSGVQYVGDFLDDVMQGEGSITLPDGSTYKGQFHGGIMHGFGVFEDMTNNSRFEGAFYKGLKDGKGKEEYADGTFYSGNFILGKQSGTGSLYSPGHCEHELVYEGDWDDDVMTGFGKRFKLTLPLAGFYVGEFKQGRRHGHGTFTAETGIMIEGRWINDRAIDGDWAMTFHDGATYYGSATIDIDSGIPVANGFGTHNDTNGAFHSGSFVDGRPHGSGICVFSTGERWDGKWENGNFSRYGRPRP